jgi:hypothetical protein
MTSRPVLRESGHAADLPSCAGPICIVVPGLGLGAPVGLRLLPAEVLGLAVLDLTFVAPGLVLRTPGLGVATVGLGGAVLLLVAVAIESVMNGTPGDCNCTPRPVAINTSGHSTH